MTSLTIPATDHGLIRIFGLTGQMPDGLQDNAPDAIQRMFGTDALDPTYIDVVDTGNLAGLSLIDYLHQGYDVPEQATVDPALRNLRGIVILLMSRAAGGREVQLKLDPAVRHVTTVGDPARLRIPGGDLPHAGAKRAAVADKPAPSPAAMSGRVATAALVVLLALVVVMIWIAA